MNKLFFLSVFVTLMSTVQAQYYGFGGFDYGFLNLPASNSIINEFNDREEHALGAFSGLTGYRFGLGRYAQVTTVEIGFGVLSARKNSVNPSLLKENVDFIVNMSSLSASIAARPFKYRFHSVGASLHLGQMRYRYSFGGDYIVPVNYYSIWGEAFVELGFPFRFLIKKEARDKLFYIFKIRPYYNFSNALDISAVQRDFNEDPSVNNGSISEKMNHLGIRLSICIPFLTKDEQAIYKRGGTLDIKRRQRLENRQKKAAEKTKKNNSKGRL